MAVEIVVPELSALPPERVTDEADREEGPVGPHIAALYFEEGEEVEDGEVFAIVSNGFGAVEILSPASGTVIDLCCHEEDPVEADDVIAVLETDA
jgi:biotin carboxyl carrier protein